MVIKFGLQITRVYMPTQCGLTEVIKKCVLENILILNTFYTLFILFCKYLFVVYFNRIIIFLSLALYLKYTLKISSHSNFA